MLLVRRPDDDDEFPGMWGLPAASCRDGEGVSEAAERIADQKLGTTVVIIRELDSGSQERERYVIEMCLLEAVLADPVVDFVPIRRSLPDVPNVTMYTDFRWGFASDLIDSAAGGSLCSKLFLRSEV